MGFVPEAESTHLLKMRISQHSLPLNKSQLQMYPKLHSCTHITVAQFRIKSLNHPIYCRCSLGAPKVGDILVEMKTRDSVPGTQQTDCNLQRGTDPKQSYSDAIKS